MDLEIRELKASELSDAVEFAQAAQSSVEPGQVDLRLSIIARDNTQILGMILCVGADSSDRQMRMTLEQNHRNDATLIQHLMNKALLKARSAGLSRLRITPDPALDQATFWTDVNWQSHVDNATPDDNTAPQEEDAAA